ncbi:MAG: hypothetical protein ACKVQA_23565 [Burkholderiales bacterium]
MKRTELEKKQGKKIDSAIAQGKISHRFGHGVASIVDKREQRKRDQALGLIPFAVKLESSLVKEVQDLAQKRELGLNEAVAEILRKGLGKKG